MSEKIRVLNAGPNVLMIDSVGRVLDPGAAGEVAPEDPETSRHLDAGRLIRLEDPTPPTKKTTPKTSESGDK